MQGFATLRRRRLTLKIRISYIVIRIYKLLVAGANTIGVLDFSPTYYQVYHRESGT